MAVTQQAQNIDAPAGDAIAEAVKGLARDRSMMVSEIRDTSAVWTGYPAWYVKQMARIATIDARIDSMLAMHVGRQGGAQ